MAVSGPKSIHFFIQEVIKLKYIAKYILIGMSKAELVPKKQNHDIKIDWELLNIKMPLLAQEVSQS